MPFYICSKLFHHAHNFEYTLQWAVHNPNINWLCDAVTLERKHFIKRMDAKICKHFSGTITLWQEHKSSQAVVVCNFQLFQCCFCTIKPHRCTIKVRTIRFKQETFYTNGTFRKFSQQ